MISRGLPIFGSFCELLRNVVTETFAEAVANCQVSSNRILIGTISRLSCPFICVKLVIHENLISQGLLIFGSFCKPLRNPVTETFAEPSANWEVSSNRILTGRQTILLLYECQIGDSLFDVRFPPCQFYLIKCEVTRAPNFQKVLQTSEEFCNKNIPVVFTTSTNNGGLQGGF